MELRVTVVEPNQQGVRDHHCLELHKVIGLRVDALPAAADIFCPLCGQIVASDPDRHRYTGTIRIADYDGPRCEHGQPDKTCSELADAYPEAAVGLAAASVREFVAAKLARRYDCSPTIVDWVRPCPSCRRERAVENLAMLGYELGVVAKRLSDDLRARHRERAELAEASVELQGVIRAFESLREDVNDVPPLERRGFVYLIRSGDAVKIGFSEKHPQVSRLSELQVGSPEKLALIGFVPGTTRDERQLHRLFARHRIRGEWFRCAAEIMTHFRASGPAP